MLNYLGELRVKTAKLQIESFGSALDLFFLDAGRYPTTSEGLNALVQRPSGAQVWTGPYLKNGKLPVDPWGNPYQYRSPADRVPMRSCHSAPTAAKAAPARRPTFRTSSAEAQAGFTLIEVMAVMAIVALLASLAIGMSRGTGRGQLKALALETADLLRRQRLSAVLTGSRRQVFIDGGGRTLFGDGRKTVKLPDDVVLDVLGAGSERSGERAIVRFEPDGSSSGAAFRVSARRLRLRDPRQLVHRRGDDP